MLQICQNIERARKKKGLTQDEVAKLLGKGRSTYSNWEKTIEPDMATLREIAKVLDTSIAQLIGEDVLIDNASKVSLATILKIEAQNTIMISVMGELLAHQRGELVEPMVKKLESMVQALLPKGTGE